MSLMEATKSDPSHCEDCFKEDAKTPEHVCLALHAAAKSVVVLRTEADALPLSSKPGDEDSRVERPAGQSQVAVTAIAGMFFPGRSHGESMVNRASYTGSPLRTLENELGVQAAQALRALRRRTLGGPARTLA